MLHASMRLETRIKSTASKGTLPGAWIRCCTSPATSTKTVLSDSCFATTGIECRAASHATSKTPRKRYMPGHVVRGACAFELVQQPHTACARWTQGNLALLVCRQHRYIVEAVAAWSLNARCCRISCLCVAQQRQQIQDPGYRHRNGRAARRCSLQASLRYAGTCFRRAWMFIKGTRSRKHGHSWLAPMRQARRTEGRAQPDS
jgi:hypothetical protein